MPRGRGYPIKSKIHSHLLVTSRSLIDVWPDPEFYYCRVAPVLAPYRITLIASTSGPLFRVWKQRSDGTVVYYIAINRYSLIYFHVNVLLRSDHKINKFSRYWQNLNMPWNNVTFVCLPFFFYISLLLFHHFLTLPKTKKHTLSGFSVKLISDHLQSGRLREKPTKVWWAIALMMGEKSLPFTSWGEKTTNEYYLF